MSYEKFEEYMDRYLKEQAEKPVPAWAQKTGEWDKAKAEGITDGRRPQALITRAEAAAMVLRGTK